MINGRFKIVYRMLKVYPIIVNVMMLACLFFPGITNYVFDITGASLYTIIICFFASFPFKLCGWYRVLCISSIISLILEYIDINFIKINHYICIIQIIIIAGILIALWKIIRLGK